ncbi:MAG: insulinase family protein [Oscillospiraceae bacterium]|nr:insulinase family protein [Oscillospiraceae bacterium]
MKKTYYPRLDETVCRKVLPNGLNILVVPKPGFTRKIAYFVTNYGSVHTSFTLDGKAYTTPAGVAHYLEHKMFDMPDRDVTAEFAALGASPNAFTSYGLTAYYFSCTENFAPALRLLLEFVSTPYFTEESVEKERGIIAQEILMYADSADSVVMEEMNRGLYHHHPIRVSIAGTVESIQDITAQTLYDCHKAFYHPANMTLCVVGDVDAEEVAAIAGEILPKEKSPVAVPDFGLPEPQTALTAVSRREMDVAMTTFQLAFKCPPPAKGKDHAHQELVAEIAAEMLFGQSSQLYQWLYEDGLIDSSFGGGEEFTAGTAMLTCGGDSRDPEEVRNCIINEAKFLAENGLDQAAFDRIKRSFLGIRFKDLTSFDGTCFRLVAYSMEDHDYFDFPSIFQEVTIEEVRQFIADNVRPEKCALSIVDPRRKD